MTLKNADMRVMMHQLKPLLSHRDKIGYVAARNYRKLTDALVEYETFRNGLIEKYGETDRDDDGNELPTISLKMGSPKFRTFCSELEPFNNIEHEVELMTIPYEEVVGVLSGEEILSVDWMFEE